MNVWWQSLNAREKRLTAAAMGLLALLLVWLLVVKPLIKRQQLFQQDLANAQTINQTLNSQRANILQSRGKGAAPPNSNTNLYSAVAETLKQHQLDGEGTSSEEKEQNNVRIKLDGKPFDALMRFLDQMEREHAALTSSMTIKATGKGGLADAEIVLQR